MLKQSTRERLQALVQNPNFLGSVHIKDSKHQYNDETYCTVWIDIFGEGFNVFNLLATEFPDIELANVEPYETDHGEYLSFGSFGKGTIEKAEVRVWATYGQKEKDTALTESIKETIQSDYIAEEVMAQ